MNIMEWCNSNEGFTNTILAVLSLLFSIIAIIISIRTNKVQIQIGLFQNRLEIYSELERIYSFCKRFIEMCKNKKEADDLSLRTTTYMLIYGIGSKEREICYQLIQIEKEIRRTTDQEEKKELMEQYMETMDQLDSDIIREEEKLRKLKSGFFLMYSEKYHSIVEELLNIYEDLYTTHFVNEYNDFMAIMETLNDCIEKMEKSNFSNRIAHQTLL